MSGDDYEAYVASMPTSYHEAFDDEAVEAHAEVVSRRHGSATRVEIWKELPERVVAICIVAEDRPGLLSQISAALVAQEIDVVSAHAYCRSVETGGKEAIFRAQLQIIGLRATSEKGRASDRFHLAELDGKPLVLGRLLALQVEIFSAIESDGAAA